MKELPENWCFKGTNRTTQALSTVDNNLFEKIKKKFPGIGNSLCFYKDYYYYSNGNDLIPSGYLPANKTEISFEDFERYVLSDVKFNLGDRIKFDLGSEVLTYMVYDYFLSNLVGVNNSIFKKLGFTEIEADKFCSQHLGDSMKSANRFTSGAIATYSSGDYEAANRLIDALQAECKKFREGVSSACKPHTWHLKVPIEAKSCSSLQSLPTLELPNNVANFGWTGRAAPDWSSGTPSPSNGLQNIIVGTPDHWSTLQYGMDLQKLWANCGSTVLKWSDLANAIEDKYIIVNKGKDKLRNFKF